MASRLEVMQQGRIVESGQPRAIFQKPQHSYTRALLAALPGTRRAQPKVPAEAQPGQEAAEPILRVTDLKTHLVDQRNLWGRARSHVRAVDGVSFSIAKAATLGVVGESGSGKTTLARSILRLVEPTSGSVTFHGEPIEGLRGADLRRVRRRLQIIFQDPFSSLNPRMQVGQALGEVLKVHRIVPGNAVEAQVGELLERVGLDPQRRRQYPHEFSGGERQRIVIARALAVQPEMLICDEPVSSLDMSIQAQILELLGRLQKDLGLSYLFISHDIRVIRQVSDEVAVMQNGRFVELGSVEQVLEDPQHDYTRSLLAACPKDPVVAC
jgi:ABC-type glutathione transport system ATPase component